jgi:inhibitor of cysteine peptidase
LQLPENPSTGYRWELKPFNDETLKLQGDTYQAPTTIAMGVGGTRIFEFIAQSSGIVHLCLQLKKPWNSENDAMKMFEVTVQVFHPKLKLKEILNISDKFM